MKFPAKSLVPVGGEIYAHIFENDLVELPRNLFWSFKIDFAPIQYGEDPTQWPCSMTCEWITFPIRNWKALDRQSLDVDYGDRGIESTFYVTEHDIGTHTKMKVTHRERNIFRVQMAMTVEFHGFYGDDADEDLKVKADVDLPFDNVIFAGANLSPEPKSNKDALAIAADYLDLDAFHPITESDGIYTLKPKW